jgi:hypothetical protein
MGEQNKNDGASKSMQRKTKSNKVTEKMMRKAKAESMKDLRNIVGDTLIVVGMTIVLIFFIFVLTVAFLIGPLPIKILIGALFFCLLGVIIKPD